MNTERRHLAAVPELRFDAETRTAYGYAAMYGKRSKNLGGFFEYIDPAAFRRTVGRPGNDIVALRDHNESRLLGRTTAGTLRLDADDPTGLGYEIDLPDTTEGRDTGILLERRDLVGSSFGFRTIEDRWDEDDDGYPIRTLLEVQLFDVGPVTFPAYDDTAAAVRSLANLIDEDAGKLAAALANGAETRHLLTAGTITTPAPKAPWRPDPASLRF